MTLSELCIAADIPRESFKQWRFKGVLPFDVSRTEAEDGAGRKWTRYTIHEAARLIAARTLADAGAGWSEACAILRGPSRLCGAIGPGQHPAERPGVFVARATYADRDPVVFEGALEAIARAAAAHAAPLALIAVDLSAAYAMARDRMADFGLASDSESIT